MMKNISVILVFVAVSLFTQTAKSQGRDTTLYLLTCGPGTEIYSIYGHSALLVDINGRDTVYNWGVFDFDTPNFAWKFAKGRLDYMLASETLNRFLRGYNYEQRYVLAQEINLNSSEKRTILELVNENLQQENVKYRYDFFYDDCSTRIRDLIEKAIGSSLTYTNEEEETTFRNLIGQYQKFYPWLQFGVDLLIGSNAEKKAGVREKMFLPEYLMSGLSEASVERNGTSTPLLDNAIVLLDFKPPVTKINFYTSPFFIFSIFFLLIAFVTLKMRSVLYNNYLDYFILVVFALLGVLMVFFNFFTDHEQLRSNYNIIWLNPLLIILFFSLFTGWKIKLISRLVFFIAAFFLLTHLFLPQAFNAANYPLVLLLMLRTMVRSDFRWSPVHIM